MRTFDNGSGTLWVYCESLGPLGLVRADTWEEAYETVQDEIQDGCTWEELQEVYGLSDAEFKAVEDGECLPEGAEWRGNGEPSNEGIHGEIALSDLNGTHLFEASKAEEILFNFTGLLDSYPEIAGCAVGIAYEGIW